MRITFGNEASLSNCLSPYPVAAGLDRESAGAGSWMAVDWAVAIYATFVALVAVVWAVPRWPYLLGGHAALLAGLLSLPPRGAPWERPRAADSRWRMRARSVARFLRYTYPALLLTPFFEEVSLTVNAAAASVPYWFEHSLFNADRLLFGSIPSVTLSQAGHPLLDEIMHAFHLSYFPLIIGGITLAWNGGRRGRVTPGAGFHVAMTTMMLGFFLSYVWYPFLPARAPWEHPDVMSGLRSFGGWVFTPLSQHLIAGTAVSGGWFSERSRVGHVGADLRTVRNQPESVTLLRSAGSRTQRGVRLYEVPPCSRRLRRARGCGSRGGNRLQADAADRRQKLKRRPIVGRRGMP